MAMVASIPEGLRNLSGALSKLKELSEWARLAREEARPDDALCLRFPDDQNEDFRNQYGIFVRTAMEVKEGLNNPALSLSEDDRSRWHLRLRELERELRQLDLNERFISP
jgi:hypothetical protein